MSRTWKRTSQILALFLIGVMSQVYVLAGTGGAPVVGRLTAYGEGGISVNGNQASTGTTIFSGAQLQTSAKSGATISLPSMAEIEISPNTNLSLTFDRSQVSVHVISGSAVLSTSAGVKGELTTPDGKTAVTDPATASTVGGTAPQNRTDNPCRIGGIPCALFWVMVGGGTAVALYFALRDNDNPSPSTP